MKFEEKVRGMSAKEIIMAMIDGLRNPYVSIDMDTFGDWQWEEGGEVCFGCAATNTICQISGKVFDPSNISYLCDRSEFVGADKWFLDNFESAIDHLRLGDIDGYNHWAEEIGIARIINFGLNSPELDNSYTEEQLEVYEQLANNQN